MGRPPSSDLVINYDYRQDGGDGWGDWNQFIATTNSRTVTGLSNGATYSFQVRANNNIGEGAESDTVTATPVGPPAAPDLRATPGDGEVRLFWADLNDASITKFQYRKRITDVDPVTWDPDWEDISGSATTIDHTVSSLTNGIEYTFEVRAINDGGQGVVGSITAIPSTTEIPPSAMSNVQHVVSGVTDGSGGTVTFTWDDPSNSQIDEYQYRYDATESNPPPCDENGKPDGCGWDVGWTGISSSAISTSGGTITWAPTIPGSSTILFYRLRAVNTQADVLDTTDVNEGASPWTAITVSRSNTPGTSTNPPGAPGDLTATPGVGQVTLSWTTPTTPTDTNITKYQYRHSTSQDSEGNAIWTDWVDITTTTSGTTTSGTVSSLSDGTTYTFEVRAFHNNMSADDTSDDVPGAAAQAEDVTPGTPNAPTIDKAEADADEQITLTWTVGAPIDGVTVTRFEYRQQASGDADWGEWTEITGSDDSTTTHSVTSLEIGTDYEFQVRAVSASGGSQPSDTASATTIGPPPPLKPTGLTATPGDDSVTLRWKSPGDLTIDKYHYQQTETVSGGTPDFSASPPLLIKDSGSGTIKHEVPDLEVGTLYYFQIQSGSAYGDSEASDYVSARPLPVRGEWSFEASINPNPLSSGETAVVTFTATYTVTSGDPTALAFDITDSDGGETPSIDVQLSDGDNGRVGLDDSFGTSTGATPRDINNNITCVQQIDEAKGEIVCSFSELVEVFSKTGATPGKYGVTLTLGNGITFEAKATTSEHAEFLSAAASADEMGEIAVELEVDPGVPEAPKNLAGTGGNSRVALVWDEPDPQNPNITGYEYQQTTTQPGITLRWTGSSDPNVARYQYRHTTTEPSIILSWAIHPDLRSGDSVVYQYRRTTTEPGITLRWTDPGDPPITDYQYRQTTQTSQDSDGNTVGVFTGINWVDISGSGPTTTSHKVTTGLDFSQTYFFEVRPVRDEEPGNPLTPTSQTVEYFDGAAWMTIPNSGLGTISYTVTGIDVYETHYFEVRPFKDKVALSNIDPLTDTVHKFEGATWTDIPESSSGEANRNSYKATGFDIRVPQYFEVRPVRVGSPVGVAIDATATASVTLSWELSASLNIAKYQYQHTTTITTEGGKVLPDFSTATWTDVSTANPSTTTYTLDDVDVSTPNFYQVRPFTMGGEGLDPIPSTIAANAALTWTTPSDVAIGMYQYRASTDGETTWGDWTDIPGSDASTISHTVEGIDLSTSHSFQVQVLEADYGDLETARFGQNDVVNFQGETWETIPDSAPGEANALSYPVTGLTNGATYYFRIRAVTDGGEGPESNTAEATTLLGAPAAPTGLEAKSGSDITEVDLSWDDPSDPNITKYQYRQTTTAIAELTWTADPDATAWQYHHSVDGGSTYGEWMDTGITEADAATATSTTISGVNPHLRNVFEVRPVKAGGDQDPVTPAQTIAGDFTDSNWNSIDGSEATTTTHRLSGLDLSANSYYFEVRPVLGQGDPEEPPVDLTKKYLGDVTLTWDNPGDGTITKHQYQLKVNDGTFDDWEDIPDSGLLEGNRGRNAASYTIPDLKALEEDPQPFVGPVTQHDFLYTVKVRAVNLATDGTTDQFGTESVEVKANPGLPLDAPTKVNVDYALATNTFTISWEAHEIVRAEFEVSGTGPGGALPPVTSEATTSGEETTAATSADIQTDLFGDFTFEVRTREDFGPWSETVTVSKTASPFAEASLTREVGDTAAAGANVGKPVTVAATVTGYSVAYALKESASSQFTIDPVTGQISMRDRTPARGAYDGFVTASLSKAGVTSEGTVAVTINVTTMDPWLELAKFTAPDGALGDALGSSAAVDGDTGVSVIGAPEVGEAVGAAYVYERPTDYSPAKLTSPSPADDEKFGASVAVDGDTVVVGTSGTNEVYVFTKPLPPLGWSDSDVPAATLSGTSGEGFGRSVAISGDTIFVGAKDAGTDDYGAVYVFVKPDGADWANSSTPTTTLTASDGATGAEFGSSVTVEGDDLVVADSGAQAVYYFAKPDGGWADGNETAKLTATGDPVEDWSGALSADIYDDTIVVGATQIVTGVTPTLPGAVYVFTGSGTDWTQVATLTALGGDPGDGFGKHARTNGDYIAAGRRNQADNDRASSVQVFKRPPGGWTSPIVPSVVLASDGEAGDLFGHAVDLDGELMVVGALHEDDRGDGAGAAYLFTTPTLRAAATIASPYVNTIVTSPDGATQVTILSGAVPTRSRHFQHEVQFRGCGSFTGSSVYDCIWVQLYDLRGDPVPFNVTPLVHEAEVTLAKPSSRFTVRKRSGSPSWRTVPECPATNNEGECYTIVDNSIVVTGITSFSQYAVTVSPPSAPRNLVATAGNRSVALTWTTPTSQGGSAITGYQFTYDSGRNWRDIPGSDSSTISYTVRGLTNFVTYTFAVRAVNSAGPGSPSNSVNATPRATRGDIGSRRPAGGGVSAQVPPNFDEGNQTTRRIAENSPAGTRIGGPLTARDALERRVTYSKAGPDADLFDVASQTGQIFVRRNTNLDFESSRKSYLIEVIANTGVGGPGRIAVTIVVTNVPEAGTITVTPATAPEAGTPITATLSDPDGGVNGVSWQWQRSSDGRTWNDIPGATSASYTPTEADRGIMLRASVGYNDAAAAGTNLVGMAIGPVPMPTPPLPVDRPGSVTLSPEGAPEVGTEIAVTLTDSDGGVTGEMWQWQRSADGVTWTAIDGASAASYTPVEADVGMMLRANVSYSDAVAAGVSLVSATTGTVAEMPAPDRPGSVTLSPEGTPAIGKAITATVTDPDGEVTGEMWQWQRSADGVTWTAIDGASAASYTPVEADVGMMLRANVSYSDAAAAGVNAMGTNTEAVAAGPAPELETPTPTPTPPSPPVRPATPTPTPALPVVPPSEPAPTPTATMLPTPPPTDVPPTPTAVTVELTPTEAPTTVTPEEEGGFPAWLIVVIIIGAVIIIAGIIIIVRSRMQQ